VNWFKHAFAVEQQGPAQPTERQQQVVGRVCNEIVRRHLSTPALIFLEMSRPLNFVGAQVLHFFSPFLTIFTDTNSHQEFAAFLEQRGSIDYICTQIEQLESKSEIDSEQVQKSPESS